MALTQSQMIAAVADRAEMSKADTKRALAALDEIVLEELGNAQEVRIGGLVQLTVRVKPAQKKRKGRNPATGERSMLPTSPRASMFEHDRWPRPRRRSRQCKRPGDGSPRRTGAPPGKSRPASASSVHLSPATPFASTDGGEMSAPVVPDASATSDQGRPMPRGQ